MSWLSISAVSGFESRGVSDPRRTREACPASFDMADDGFAHMKDSKRVGSNDELDLDDLGCTKEAAEGCPVNIIHIFEGSKKII